ALRPLALGLVLAAAIAPAAASARRPASRPPITVVATTTQLQDFVRNVGGAHVHVVGLLRPNVDPHEYEPRPSDVSAVEAARVVATVPPARRKLVTDHDAFGYLARRYGIQVIGAVIPSLSSGAEPSARSLAELIDTIRKAGVKVIFSESSVSPKLAREVASEA